METMWDEHGMPRRERQGNVLLGAVGSIMGGLVGAIPWILIALLGYVASLGGVLISLAAFYGYKLFGGRMDRVSVVVAVNIVTVVVMAFVATILGECAVFYADAVKEGYEVNIPALLEFGFLLPFDAELAAESGIWGSLGMSYLYAGLGTAAFLAPTAKKLKLAKQAGRPLPQDMAASETDRA